MIRNVALEDISDGSLYTENDMVRIDTMNCSGCKQVCCRGMGRTIVLDPYDMCQLTAGLGETFEQLLGKYIELNIVDGCILPNLKMDSETDACLFLDRDNLCKIHHYRPGICRMFPLGRYWEDKSHFKYILQKDECNKEHPAKIKIKKWLALENMDDYNTFVISWHQYLSDVRACVPELSEEQLKTLNMYNLKTFYITPYSSCGQFYSEFENRIVQSVAMFGL